MSKLYDLLQSIINKVKNTEKSLESVPKTVNGVEPDENGNVTVSSSWNDLTDKPFYCDLELIDTALNNRGNGDKYFDVNPASNYPICIEINETRFYDLMDFTGDGDSSLWADGGGMGFYIERPYNDNYYTIAIDTARYGNIADAKIKMYHQVVSKTLPSHYLPVPDYNKMGGVKANMFDDPVSEGYCECAVGPDGTLYSKEFLATKHYSELSIDILYDLCHNIGDHGLFTDSIATEISDVVDLTLPVHAWYTGANYSSTPYKFNFIIESADGTTWHMVTTTSKTVHSVTKIASSGGSGGMSVTISAATDEYGESVFSADKTYEELVDAYDSGQTISMYMEFMHAHITPVVTKVNEMIELSHPGFEIYIYSDNYVHFEQHNFIDQNEFEEYFGELGIPNWYDMMDKPPWHEKQEELIFEKNITLQAPVYGSGTTATLHKSDFIKQFELGSKYNVMWRDSLFEDLECYQPDDDTHLYLGDVDFIKCPFYISYSPNTSNSNYYFRSMDSQLGGCNVIISKITSDAVYIDEDYIPDTIARVEDVNALIDERLGSIPTAEGMDF